ncbi:NHLP leader peptide family natural product precursor [Kordia sp. TARA_039_SRF]|nr:NHLP leader peptide family natural product precursor [Kordia sp. TARA_039_SRF]
MKPTSSQQKSQELLEKIIHKAWSDDAFKAALIANPLDAIEKATGERVQLPEGKTLIVRDQTSQEKIYVNIPAEPNMEDLELSEDQLEVVAGGGIIWPAYVMLPILPVDPIKDGRIN